MEKDAETGGSRRNAVDFRDQQDELAGRETGRTKRFLSPEARAEAQEEKRREETYRNLLAYLLANDAEYAALFGELCDKVDSYERAAAKALQALTEEIAVLDEQLERMEENADTLDGKKVFFSRDGKRAYTEDGKEVSAGDMARISRNKDAPSWEEYQETQKQRDKAKGDYDEITRWQDNVLNPVKDRIHDKENPVPKDEIGGIMDDMDKGIPKGIMPYLEDAPASPANKPEEKQSYINAPPIQSHFDNARMDIPDLTVVPTPATVPKLQ